MDRLTPVESVNAEVSRVARELLLTLSKASKWPMYTYSDNNRDSDGNLYMQPEDMQDIFRRALVIALAENEKNT